MNAQQSELFDLLDGFEMTKSQHDWLERRFENMTVKEKLLFRGALQIERPQMTADVMLIANQLDHYDLFYGAGDDARLGKFVMEQIQRPSSQARAFLDPEKVGAAYRQKGGNTFCNGHFIKVTSLIDPFLDGDPTLNPDKGDYGIRVKLASRSNMEGVWVMPRDMELADYGKTLAKQDGVYPKDELLASCFDAEGYANQRMKNMGLSAAEHGFVSWNGTELVYEYSQPDMEPTMSM